MATDTGDDGGSDVTVDGSDWSEADRQAALAVEQKCGIALVPDGLDD